MSGPRQVYEFLKESSMLHAQWELEVSTSIFKSRKKLLICSRCVCPFWL